MDKIIECFEKEFPKKLKNQLREHRKKQHLTQQKVAKKVRKSLDTYQRWETGEGLVNIYSLRSVFHVLGFSTTEIIDLLGLPPLTSNEIEAICQDEETLKDIKEHGFYFVIRKKSSGIDDITLVKSLIVLLEEHVKRLKNRR